MAEKGYGEIKARAKIFPSDIDKNCNIYPTICGVLLRRAVLECICWIGIARRLIP